MRGLDGIQAPPERHQAPRPAPTVSARRATLPRLTVPATAFHMAGGMLLLAALVSAGFWLHSAGSRFLAVEASSAPVTLPTAEPAAEQPAPFATGYQTPTGTGQPIAVESPLPASLPQPDEDAATTALPTIRILTGGAPASAATAVRDTLDADGYQVIATGPAKFSYVRSTVYYLAGRRDAARAAATAAGLTDPTLVEDPIAAPADVLLVLGTDRS